VFRAHDTVRDRPVAVKLFTLDLTPDRLNQLVAEFKRIIAANLTHPALAAPLATGIHDVSAYLVQDFVAADAVDQVIREYGAAPPVDALRVAAQLAGALDFAAAVQVRHGALHPRDVLLSSDETRLTGIGVAHALERIGIAAPVRRPYSPPERIAGGAWDRRADVFSLASLLRAVFARALAEDPALRFATALEFAEALRQACPGIVSAVDQPVSGGDQLEDLEQFDLKASDATIVTSPVSTARIPDRVEPRLPLVDTKDEIDLPLSVIVAAEDAQFAEVEAASSKPVPDAHTSDARAVDPTSRAYVDFGRDDTARIDPTSQEPTIVMPVAVPQPPSATRARPSADEPSRPSMAPMVLALAVGITIGFVAGYGVGTRRPPAPTAAPVAEAPLAPPAGQEFTESPVVSSPPPAAAAAPPTSAVAPPAAAAAAPPLTPPTAAASPKPEAATPAPAAEGRLLVRSTPAGALVFVDGTEYGPTPVAVRALSPGGHRVRVVRPGYAAAERRVVITASRPSQSVTIELERAGGVAARGADAARPPAAVAGSSGRFTGALTVVSRPPGATVYLDGSLVGTAPLSLPSVTAGSHAIRLEHDGYRRWTSAIRVVAGQPNRITASLER
jgi:serine/threonine protein kinase